MSTFNTRPLLTPWGDFNIIIAGILGFQSTIHSRGSFFNQMDVLRVLAILSHCAFMQASPYSKTSPARRYSDD